MRDFDPSRPAILHDRLQDAIIPWTGEHQDEFRRDGRPQPDGSVAWDGRVLDGLWNVLGG
jgi:hypothetical protein